LAQSLDLPAEIPDLNVLSVGTLTMLRPLRVAVAQIADLHFEYELAFWIARVAAGLQLVRKRKPTYQERVFALLIAADSMNRLIYNLDLRLPSGPATVMKWNKNE
jgi:hypothetical protein